MSDEDRYSGMKYAGLGLEFAGAVAGLTLLGWWIDRQMGSAPWGLLIGLAIGLIGGIYNLIRQVTAETRRAEARRKAGTETTLRDGYDRPRDAP